MGRAERSEAHPKWSPSLRSEGGRESIAQACGFDNIGCDTISSAYLELEGFGVDKNLAERLLEKLNEINAPFNDAVELVEQISDIHEKKRFRRGLAELMGHAYTDLMMPIHDQYPELNPFKKT